MIKRTKFKEVLATIRGALFLFFTFNSMFIVLGVIALGRLINDGPNELFLIGDVPIPKLLGAGATNLAVVVFCGVGIILVGGVIVRRYFYYKRDIELLRSKGIYDVNQDGKVDSFADDLFD